MKKEENRITVKKVFNETRAMSFGFSSQLLYFALFTILSLVLAYVLPFTLLITIPLVIVPSYFAYSSTNSIKGMKNAEGIGFFTFFRSYFTGIFFGGYRLILGFFKALLGYLATNTVLITIFEITIFAKSSEFQETMKLIQEGTDSATLYESLDKFTDALLTSPEIQKWIYLSAAISLFVGAIIYIQHMIKHSIKMRRNLFTKQIIPTKQFNFVDRRVRKDNRKFLFSTYSRTCWFIQLLLVLVGAGGIAGSFFLLKEFSPEHALIISLFLMFVVALPFFNYISKLQHMIFMRLARKYEETFATLTLEFLTKYKEKIGLEEEEAKKLEEILNAQKEANKEEDGEENKDLEDK